MISSIHARRAAIATRAATSRRAETALAPQIRVRVRLGSSGLDATMIRRITGIATRAARSAHPDQRGRSRAT
jgi:hypothetical protein